MVMRSRVRAMARVTVEVPVSNLTAFAELLQESEGVVVSEPKLLNWADVAGALNGGKRRRRKNLTREQRRRVLLSREEADRLGPKMGVHPATINRIRRRQSKIDREVAAEIEREKQAT